VEAELDHGIWIIVNSLMLGGLKPLLAPEPEKIWGLQSNNLILLDDTTDISNVVEQTTRRDYVKDSAVFTHTKTNLAIGDHKIKIFYNTNDGRYNSGAFYGATFNFS
jgi:hypothetical protein